MPSVQCTLSHAQKRAFFGQLEYLCAIQWKKSPFNPEIRPFDAKSFTNPNAPRYPFSWSAESHRKHPNRAAISTALSLHALPATHYALFLPHEPSNLPRHLHHVAPISLLFSAASAYFPSPRGCTLHHSRGSDAQTCERANSFVYRGLVPLCSLLRALALCFQWFAASFCKTPGVGVCPQTLRLTSTRCRLFACARPPLSGPGAGRAQRTTHHSLPTFLCPRTLC